MGDDVRYIGHMTVTSEIAVEFEGDFVDKRHPYRAAQKAALYAAQDQGLIDTTTAGSISVPWIENVSDEEETSECPE